MAHGIQVFNADGSLQFDASNRLLRSLTSVMSGTSNGSLAVTGLVQGSLAAVAVAAGEGIPPVITGSGTTVNWSFDGIPAERRGDVRVNVMVF